MLWPEQDITDTGQTWVYKSYTNKGKRETSYSNNNNCIPSLNKDGE